MNTKLRQRIMTEVALASEAGMLWNDETITDEEIEATQNEIADNIMKLFKEFKINL